MSNINQDLPLTEAFYYILVTLYGEPKHGYGIMQEIEEMSEGRVTIGAGTLYTALNTLLKKGWIQNFSDNHGSDTRRKVYTITVDGQTTLRAEISRLEDLLRIGRERLHIGGL